MTIIAGGSLIAGGEVVICSWWTFNSGLIHGDEGVTIACGNVFNQGIITAGKAIESLFEDTMLDSFTSLFAGFEFLIMLIIAIRKFYFTGAPNEIERTVEEAMSISTTSETSAITTTDLYATLETQTTTMVSNPTLTSHSSTALGDQYMILILVCFLFLLNKF